MSKRTTFKDWPFSKFDIHNIIIWPERITYAIDFARVIETDPLVKSNRPVNPNQPPGVKGCPNDPGDGIISRWEVRVLTWTPCEYFRLIRLFEVSGEQGRTTILESMESLIRRRYVEKQKVLSLWLQRPWGVRLTYMVTFVNPVIAYRTYFLRSGDMRGPHYISVSYGIPLLE